MRDDQVEILRGVVADGGGGVFHHEDVLRDGVLEAVLTERVLDDRQRVGHALAERQVGAGAGHDDRHAEGLAFRQVDGERERGHTLVLSHRFLGHLFLSSRFFGGFLSRLLGHFLFGGFFSGLFCRRFFSRFFFSSGLFGGLLGRFLDRLFGRSGLNRWRLF